MGNCCSFTPRNKPRRYVDEINKNGYLVFYAYCDCCHTNYYKFCSFLSNIRACKCKQESKKPFFEKQVMVTAGSEEEIDWYYKKLYKTEHRALCVLQPKVLSFPPFICDECQDFRKGRIKYVTKTLTMHENNIPLVSPHHKTGTQILFYSPKIGLSRTEKPQSIIEKEQPSIGGSLHSPTTFFTPKAVSPVFSPGEIHMTIASPTTHYEDTSVNEQIPLKMEDIQLQTI